MLQWQTLETVSEMLSPPAESIIGGRLAIDNERRVTEALSLHQWQAGTLVIPRAKSLCHGQNPMISANVIRKVQLKRIGLSAGPVD